MCFPGWLGFLLAVAVAIASVGCNSEGMLWCLENEVSRPKKCPPGLESNVAKSMQLVPCYKGVSGFINIELNTLLLLQITSTN